MSLVTILQLYSGISLQRTLWDQLICFLLRGCPLLRVENELTLLYKAILSLQALYLMFFYCVANSSVPTIGPD